MKKYFKKLFRILQIFLIFAIITGWLYSGWPQVFNFPPKIQEAQAAIAKAGTDTTGTGNALTLSWSHTLVAGSNRMVVVSVGIENGADAVLSSVTYGGQTMTSAVTDQTGTSGYIYLTALFYILEANLPSDGSNTVAITYTGTATSPEINGWCGQYTGVTQGLPEATDSTLWTTGTSIANTISPSTNAWVISAVGYGNALSSTHGQGQVEVHDITDASSGFAAAELRGASGETSLDSTASGTINRGVRVAASWTEAPVNQVTIADSTLSQPTNVTLGDTAVVMGAFTFIADTSDATVTAITVSEADGVDASNTLSNVKLYAQEEGTCSFSGSSQIGTTQSFNSSEDATFSSLTLVVGTVTQQCVFVVLDVDSDAGAGNTIEIEITSSGDVSITGASPTGSFPVQISNTTTIRAGSGTVMSTEVDFDWVSGRSQWGEAIWSTTEPSGSDATTSVYYSSATTCDTIVPNSALSGNEAGFDVSASPKDISGLSTSTYNRICLRTSLAAGGATSSPSLNDWRVTWEPSAAEITCTTPLDGQTIYFGTIDDQAVYNATTASTTVISSGSVYVKIYSQGSGSDPGLYKSPDLIESPTAANPTYATDTLVIGEEGYGMQATTAVANNLDIAGRYAYPNSTSNIVGGLSTSTAAKVVASSSVAVSSEVVYWDLKAAVDVTTPGGSYQDTLTISCTASP